MSETNGTADRREKLATKKVVKYGLEIFSPGTVYDPIIVFESETPFQPIQLGDVLDARLWSSKDWPGVAELNQKTRSLRVRLIRHGINDLGDCLSHNLLIYTEAVPNTSEWFTNAITKAS